MKINLEDEKKRMSFDHLDHKSQDYERDIITFINKTIGIKRVKIYDCMYGKKVFDIKDIDMNLIYSYSSGKDLLLIENYEEAHVAMHLPKHITINAELTSDMKVKCNQDNSFKNILANVTVTLQHDDRTKIKLYLKECSYWTAWNLKALTMFFKEILNKR